MGTIISVDIGGTQIRAAVYPHDDIKPIMVRRVPTASGEEAVFDRMTALIESVMQGQQADAISVATAGPLDPRTGLLIKTPNIPGWSNFPLGKKLKDKFHVPVFIGNDANLAALGEWKYGAGQGHHDVLYLTISTGIGGGVISNDQMLVGARGMAAELGHVMALPDGPMCSCGIRGHLEAIASGTAIARFFSDEIAKGRVSLLATNAKISARDVANAANQGDELALEAFHRAGRYLGQALADFLHVFNPSIVIFGGGVSQSGPLLFDTVTEYLNQHVMDKAYLEGLQFATAQLGDDAGLIGALALAHVQLSELSPSG
jgi:glucokinase